MFSSALVGNDSLPSLGMQFTYPLEVAGYSHLLFSTAVMCCFIRKIHLWWLPTSPLFWGFYKAIHRVLIWFILISATSRELWLMQKRENENHPFQYFIMLRISTLSEVILFSYCIVYDVWPYTAEIWLHAFERWSHCTCRNTVLSLVPKKLCGSKKWGFFQVFLLAYIRSENMGFMGYWQN